MIRLFCGYAPEDQAFQERFEVHLAPLLRQGVLDKWCAKSIAPGTDWRAYILNHIELAQVIILLVSPDFLASEFCYESQVERAVARYEAGEALVLPVLLRSVDLSVTRLAKIPSLPASGRPITSWADPDDAWTTVVGGLQMLMNARKVFLKFHDNDSNDGWSSC